MATVGLKGLTPPLGRAGASALQSDRQRNASLITVRSRSLCDEMFG